MNEQEWLQCTDPAQMLEFLKDKTTDRKCRLFAVACCQRVWHLLTEIGKEAVCCAERFADGTATAKELASADNAGYWHGNALFINEEPETVQSAYFAAFLAVRGEYAESSSEAARSLGGDEANEQGRLSRDIFGNPFRPIAIDPRWQTSTVVDLGSAIYQERAFDRMPILGDALEDAGCDNDEIIQHCRGPGLHVRGCWVVDLILGKE
jgi:hypothetical protein